MSVALVRVDDRLIHGQVVVGWMRALEANGILVINDAVAADPLQRSLLPLAVPPEIRVRICRVADAPAMLDRDDDSKEKLIVLFSNPVDVLGFLRAGGRIEELNLGGMRFGPGKKQVDAAISLGSEDVKALESLRELGVPMSVRMVPDDHARDIFQLIDQAAD